MLKLLFAPHQRSTSEGAARYFLDFSDEINADVTVLKPNGKKKGVAAIFSPGTSSWLSGRFSNSGSFPRKVEASGRIFSYDLILTEQGDGLRWFRNCSAWNIVKTAWAPVLLLPKQNLFKPFKNILFINDLDVISSQPILRKLGGFWHQRHFLYPPKRRRYSSGSYCARRFDETGYRVFPQLAASHLHQFLERHEIDLVVVGENMDGVDSRVLEKLPVPVLAFNSRNRISPLQKKQPQAIPMVQKLFQAGKI